MPSALQRGDRVARARAGSCRRPRRGRPACRRRRRTSASCPPSASAAARSAGRRRRCPRARAARALPIATALPGDRRGRGRGRRPPRTRRRSASSSPRSRAPSTIAPASGCSEPRSALATSRSSSSLRDAAGGDHVGQRGLALGQRAGLVEHDRVEPADALQRGGVLDQDVVPRADARCRPRPPSASPARARRGRR